MADLPFDFNGQFDAYRPEDMQQDESSFLHSFQDVAWHGLYVSGAFQFLLFGRLAGLINRVGNEKLRQMRVDKMESYKQSKRDQDNDFKTVMTILLSGEGTGPPGLEFIFYKPDDQLCCIFYQLEFYLLHVEINDTELFLHKDVMARLCTNVIDDDRSSGKKWEALVVLILYARCFMGQPNGVLVLGTWFPANVKFNPLTMMKGDRLCQTYEKCTTWKTIKEALSEADEGSLAFICPANARTRKYDLFIVRYANQGKEEIAYQVKSSESDSREPGTNDGFKEYFLVSGTAHVDDESKKRERDFQEGWLKKITVPAHDDIQHFLGPSAKIFMSCELAKLDGVYDDAFRSSK